MRTHARTHIHAYITHTATKMHNKWLYINYYIPQPHTAMSLHTRPAKVS